MAIIISEGGKNAKKIDKSEFGKEGYLQSYIHENPESIPVYEIEEDKKLFVVAREFSTESGPIDALAIDKDGDVYVVETKLYKNPDKRTVVAQALDYGASLWRHSDYGEFINTINSRISEKFHLSFEEKVKEFFHIDQEQTEVLFETMRKNLQQGNIKFVILMDVIDDRLKDLIVFVNQNSQFDIYAVQMEYYKFESYEIIIPKLFGVEVKKDISISSPSSRRVWNENDFFVSAKENLDAASFEKVKAVYEKFKKVSDDIRWGTGNVVGSYAPITVRISPTRSIISIYSDGRLNIKFNWFADDRWKMKGVNEYVADKFKKLLNEYAKELAIPEDYREREVRFEFSEWIPYAEGIVEAFGQLKTG